MSSSEAWRAAGRREAGAICYGFGRVVVGGTDNGRDDGRVVRGEIVSWPPSDVTLNLLLFPGTFPRAHLLHRYSLPLPVLSCPS